MADVFVQYDENLYKDPVITYEEDEESFVKPTPRSFADSLLSKPSFSQFKAEMATMSNEQVIKRLLDGMDAHGQYGLEENGRGSPEEMAEFARELQRRGITLDKLRNNATTKQKIASKPKQIRTIASDEYGVVEIKERVSNYILHKTKLADLIKKTFSVPKTKRWKPNHGKLQGKSIVCWYEADVYEDGELVKVGKINKIWKEITDTEVYGPVILTLAGERITNASLKSYRRS